MIQVSQFHLSFFPSRWHMFQMMCHPLRHLHLMIHSHPTFFLLYCTQVLFLFPPQFHSQNCLSLHQGFLLYTTLAHHHCFHFPHHPHLHCQILQFPFLPRCLIQSLVFFYLNI